MHKRRPVVLSLLSSLALILAAVGVPPAAAAPAAGATSQYPPPPLQRPNFAPHRISVPVTGSGTPAVLDDRLANATGTVEVVIELQDEPAAVTYAQSRGG